MNGSHAICGPLSTHGSLRFSNVRRLTALWVLSLLTLNCGGSRDDDDDDASAGTGGSSSAGTGGSSGAGAGGSSGAGTAGKSNAGAGGKRGGAALGKGCEADADCVDGLTCEAPLFAGSSKYCTRACTDEKDTCQDLANTSYGIGVPGEVVGFLRDPAANAWNSTRLVRGTACARVDGELQCGFVCPDLSAAAFDTSGSFDGCACLPGYSWSQDAERCVLDEAYDCSLFSLQPPSVREELESFGIVVKTPRCAACNSDMEVADGLDCHTGRFVCDMVSLSFKGQCTEVFSLTEAENCLNALVYQTCDCDCPTPDACDFDSAGNFDNCACCTCTSTNASPPRPVCTRYREYSSNRGQRLSSS